MVDSDTSPEILNRTWCATYYGYAKSDTNINGDKIALLLHRVITNAPKGMEVDHINSDKLDNRKCNLRVVTPGQNKYNIPIRKNNHHAFKGVNYSKRNNNFYTRIRFQNKCIWIGAFKTPEEAAIAYARAAIKLHGEFVHPSVVTTLKELEAKLGFLSCRKDGKTNKYSVKKG